MGRMEVSVGKKGFQGTATENISLKLGPLGNTKINMVATADITISKQDVSLIGNLAGQKLSLILAGDTLSVYLSASCVNPFEIRTSVKIEETLDIAKVLEGQGGVNVDPSKLQNCIGKDLEKALNKIANEYKSLSGYSAKQATAALNKISADAAAAADAAYKASKDAARDLANSATNSASNAFKDAGNSISRAFGGKKKTSLTARYLTGNIITIRAVRPGARPTSCSTGWTRATTPASVPAFSTTWNTIARSTPRPITRTCSTPGSRMASTSANRPVPNSVWQRCSAATRARIAAIPMIGTTRWAALPPVSTASLSAAGSPRGLLR